MKAVAYTLTAVSALLTVTALAADAAFDTHEAMLQIAAIKLFLNKF